MKRDYQKSETPAIFGADQVGREVVSVASLEALKNMGASFDGNSAMLGDEWSFADMQTMLANDWIRRQPTRAGGNRITTLICGERTRNGVSKLAWFNLGSLTRQDVNREPVFTDWTELGNDFARLEKLARRTFKVTTTKKAKLTKWQDGVVVDGAFDEREIPVVPMK